VRVDIANELQPCAVVRHVSSLRSHNVAEFDAERQKKAQEAKEQIERKYTSLRESREQTGAGYRRMCVYVCVCVDMNVGMRVCFLLLVLWLAGLLVVHIAAVSMLSLSLSAVFHSTSHSLLSCLLVTQRHCERLTKT
jgi:hypothetical protein